MPKPPHDPRRPWKNVPTFSGKPPSQHFDELAGFLGVIAEVECHSYCEVGARDGDTFHVVMSSLPKGSRGVAIDLPNGAWGNDSSADYLGRAVADLNQNGYDCRMILAPSLEAVSDAANDAPYDVCLIDADHRYDAVKADWEAYRGLANVIAFHDVGPRGIRTRGGMSVDVYRLWDELKPHYRHREFIVPAAKMGIGVLWQT